MVKAGFKSEIIDLKLSCPHCQALSFAFVGYHFVVSLIVALLKLANPSNIAWHLSFIIIDSIERAFTGRHWRNFIRKCSEVMPRLVNLNSSFSVFLIMSIIRLVASLHHIVMRSVKLRCAGLSFVSMLKIHARNIRSQMVQVNGFVAGAF